jgi:hypothetical protein
MYFPHDGTARTGSVPFAKKMQSCNCSNQGWSVPLWRCFVCVCLNICRLPCQSCLYRPEQRLACLPNALTVHLAQPSVFCSFVVLAVRTCYPKDVACPKMVLLSSCAGKVNVLARGRRLDSIDVIGFNAYLLTRVCML